MSKSSSKEHEDSNSENEKLEMEENNTSEVNASFYSSIYKCLLPTLMYVFLKIPPMKQHVKNWKYLPLSAVILKDH